MRNARMDEAQAGTKIAGRTINKLRYADDIPLSQECKIARCTQNQIEMMPISLALAS